MSKKGKIQEIVQVLRSSVETAQRGIRSGIRSGVHRIRPAIHRTRLAIGEIGTVLVDAWSRARARPRLFGGIAGGVVVAACALVLALNGLPAKRTLPELVKLAQADPIDASMQVDLGHAYFEAGQRASALRAYDKALRLDGTAATDRMVENLLSCYGTNEMGAAGAIITRYKLVASEDALRALVSNARWRTRNGALNTLDGLGKAQRDDFLTVYTLDLASADCDVQRFAMEKLGRLGDERALGRIRAAQKKDEANTPWYAFSCLGDRPEDAERRILAKR